MDEAAALTQVQALLAALSKALVFQSSHGLLQAIPDRLTEIEKGKRDGRMNTAGRYEHHPAVGETILHILSRDRQKKEQKKGNQHLQHS